MIKLHARLEKFNYIDLNILIYRLNIFIKATANEERTERKIMVTYDQWSYVTIIFRVLDMVWGILPVVDDNLIGTIFA